MSCRSIGILVMLTAIAAGAAGEEIRLTQRAPANQQRQTDEATPRTTSTTVVSPSEGEPVTLPFRVTVQAPPDVEARKYNLECAFWDEARGAWVYPGFIGDGFAGGQTASTEITADMLKKFSATATRWRLRARLTDPSRAWGGWREFTLRPTQPARV